MFIYIYTRIFLCNIVVSIYIYIYIHVCIYIYIYIVTGIIGHAFGRIVIIVIIVWVIDDMNAL